MPPWAEVRRPAAQSLLTRLGPGENEAIALAMELKPSCILLDELEARREALRLGLPVSGTLGVLEKGADVGLLDLAQAIDRLLKTSFRIDADLTKEMLARRRAQDERR